MSRVIARVMALALLPLAGCCWFYTTSPTTVPQPQTIFTCEHGEHDRHPEIKRCVAADPAKPGSCFAILETDTTLSPLDRAMLRGCVLGMGAGK
jgi:hypothetical protein